MEKYFSRLFTASSRQKLTKNIVNFQTMPKSSPYKLQVAKLCRNKQELYWNVKISANTSLDRK